MRAVAVLVLGIALIGLAVALDFLANVPRSAIPAAIPMTLRIWLSSLSLVVFASADFAFTRYALKELPNARWAAIMTALVGMAGILSLPLWSLGIPGISQWLSPRWNPLTSIISEGGLTSLVKVQFAVFLVLGSASLLRSRDVAIHNAQRGIA